MLDFLRFIIRECRLRNRTAGCLQLVVLLVKESLELLVLTVKCIELVDLLGCLDLCLRCCR